MLIQQTQEHLHTLRLTGMLQAFEEQVSQPAMGELSFEERFAMLVDREVLYRENRRLERLLKGAKLRVGACVEDIDYRHPRGLEKSRMASLTSLDWVRQSLNLCLTGPTGCGKTWLACAFGNEACRRGFSVRYLRLPRNRSFRDVILLQVNTDYISPQTQENFYDHADVRHPFSSPTRDAATIYFKAKSPCYANSGTMEGSTGGIQHQRAHQSSLL